MIGKQNPGTEGRGARGPLDCRTLRQGNGAGLGPAGGPVLRHHAGVYPSPHVEFGRKSHESRCRRGDQIVQYFVGYRLMKRAATAKRPDVEFQGFQLDAALVGHVLEFQGGKVRLPGLRAKASKFGNHDANRVVPLGCWVCEGLERGTGLGHEGIGGRSSGVYECDDYFTLRAKPWNPRAKLEATLHGRRNFKVTEQCA